MTFNLLALALDAIAIVLCWKLRDTKLALPVVLAAAFFAQLVSAVVVQFELGYRGFATLRFAGMALFWHLPAVLGTLGVLLRRRWLALPASLLLVIYVYSYHIEPRNLQVTHYQYSSAPLRGLERPILIAQVSDVQAEDVSAYEAAVFEQIAASRPDLIVYTGDYLHIPDEMEYLTQAGRLNALIRGMPWTPPFGSYAVLGDSDIPALWPAVFRETGVELLSDQAVQLPLPGTRVTLAGLSPRASRAAIPADLRFPPSEPDRGSFVIYVGHSPDFVRALESRDEPFLALAGHTHGGQVQLPLIGPLLTASRLPPKYADYFGPFGNGTLSVSRGIGMERYDAPRLRFLCPPEIRLITVVPE